MSTATVENTFPEPWIGASMVLDVWDFDKDFYLHVVGHPVKRWAKDRLWFIQQNPGQPYPMIDSWSRPDFPDAGEVQKALGLR